MPIKDFNEPRRERASSERRFALGPYIFKRRASIPPEVLEAYANAGRDRDDSKLIETFEKALLELVEGSCVVQATDEKADTLTAWKIMREQGDEYDVVSFDDLVAITEWLVEGVTERPTGQPSDSPDGSAIPSDGTRSMVPSESVAVTSMPSMPEAR